ncbi:DUF4276 family protein [Desulfobacterales bacterium HSG2]|nr:DUF4276 family protein [Desulfobacterales bacterium HSG2]
MIYFMLEERSMQRALENLLPIIIPGESYEIRSHNGKEDLQLAIRKVVPTLSRQPGVAIVILHDQNSHNCFELKNKLKKLSERAGCEVLIRIVCRELEAWFLGDMAATERAYPRFRAAKFQNKKRFRNIDGIIKPSEHLRQIVPELKGYDVLPKLDTAEKISACMNVANNRSKSFNHFVTGLNGLSPENEGRQYFICKAEK